MDSWESLFKAAFAMCDALRAKSVGEADIADLWLYGTCKVAGFEPASSLAGEIVSTVWHSFSHQNQMILLLAGLASSRV
jgi:hypothetical protein